LRRYPHIKALLLLSSSVLIGCAGTVREPVLESNKDPSFQYDGVYLASVNHAGGIQYIENWEFNCSPQEFEFQFAVNESVVDMGTNEAGVQQTGFVDKDGRFRVPIPTDNSIRASGRSDSTINNGQVTIILQGELKGDNPFGYYVQGVKQFNNKGCSYRMNFSKTQ